MRLLFFLIAGVLAAGHACVETPCNCGGAETCVDGECLCTGEGVAMCDGFCVFFNSDARNCGACGNYCEDDAPQCVDGSCTCEGMVCDHVCVDTTVSDDHCGDCATPCPSDEACIGSVCVAGNAVGCDQTCGQLEGGVCCLMYGEPTCDDLQTSRENCGACGSGCGGDCEKGICGPGGDA